MERLEHIWEEHEAAVRRWLSRLSDNADTAEDLAQETYLRARAGFGRYRGGDARAWLCAIARNVFLTHSARRKRHEQLLERRHAAGRGIGDDLLLSLEVRRAVSELAPPLRAAVVMRYYRELSYREVAASLGCPLGTAKWRVHQAVAKLQEALGVTREEVTAVATRSLKEDVLAQLQLPRLRFSVQPGNCDPAVCEALQVAVTEVYGSSPEITEGANYLVCGRYCMTQPVVDSMVVAPSGKATGYHAFVSPGEGEFELYCHVIEATPGPHHTLTIIILPPSGACWLNHVVLEGEG